MKQVVFTLTGACGVPDGTAEVTDLANHFKLPTGQLISTQPVIEMSSDLNADAHRDLSFDEAVALGLFLECETRALDLEEGPG